jgi:MFS family permease
VPLIRCPDCEKSVSDAVPSCVHCCRPQLEAWNTGSFTDWIRRSAPRESGRNHQPTDRVRAAPGATSWNTDGRRGKDPVGLLLALGAALFMVTVPRLFPGGLGYGLAYGAFFGLLVGLWPHALARKQDRRRAGTLSLVGCTMAGAFGGLLAAIPGAALFALVLHLTKSDESLLVRVG